MCRKEPLNSFRHIRRYSDFFHRTIGQHIEYDLCSELEGVGKSFDVSQDTDLSLGILKVRKELLLLIIDCPEDILREPYVFV